jgi:DNA-binding GntR family transcriptional regulator
MVYSCIHYANAPVKNTVFLKGTADQIADRVRAEIESGALAPGSQLSQLQLAERFGLSRIPIREALRQLQSEGYLIYRPNKGAIVSTLPTGEGLAEIVEIRECLELRIMEHAVRQYTPAIAARASDSLKAMNRASSEAAVRGAHERFHQVLFDAASRPKMAALINDWRFHYRLDKQKAFISKTRDMHRDLLEHCANGDLNAVAMSVRAEYEIIRRTISADALR